MQVVVGVQTVPERVWPRGVDNAKPASGWSALLAPPNKKKKKEKDLQLLLNRFPRLGGTFEVQRSYI